MRLLFIVLSIVFALKSVAQDNMIFKNQNSFKPDSAILFTGVFQEIKIYIPHQKPSNLSIEEIQNVLKINYLNFKKDTLFASILVFKNGNVPLIIKDKASKKTIKKIEFKVLNVPNLQVHVGNISTEKVDRNSLLAQKGLIVNFPNSLYKGFFSVRSYQFKIPSKNVTVNINGPLLTEEVKKEIRIIPRNTTIIFSKITVDCPNCRQRRMEDIKLIVL